VSQRSCRRSDNSPCHPEPGAKPGKGPYDGRSSDEVGIENKLVILSGGAAGARDRTADGIIDAAKGDY